MGGGRATKIKVPYTGRIKKKNKIKPFILLEDSKKTRKNPLFDPPPKPRFRLGAQGPENTNSLNICEKKGFFPISAHFGPGPRTPPNRGFEAD